MLSTFVFIPIRYISVVARQRKRETYLDSRYKLLLPPKRQCQVKEDVMHGVDEIAGGLSLAKIDGQP